jgi:hypothetical protein
MQAIGGVVTALNCALCALIGVRLLRLGAKTRGPEAWLGVYFLCAPFVASILSSAVYMSWADPDLAMAGDLRAALHGVSLASMSIGYYAVFVFTQRVFRPADAWAQRVVRIASLVLVASIAGVGWMERFQVQVVNAWPYWINVAVREAAIVWMAVESFLYWSQLRRRAAVGLADPLLVNRFLLWGVWAATMSVLQASDPASRVWYWWVTGTTTTWSPEAGRPIIVSMILVASLLGAVTASTLFLTFFPTRGYRRWIAKVETVA